MWNRVAEAVGKSDTVSRVLHYTNDEVEDFKGILRDFKFVPSGRVLSSAGAGKDTTYYNCFVVGIESKDSEKGNDSRSGIMDTMSDMIEITARGGGVGINWSTIRPAGSYIKGVHGNSSGANSWMRGADGLADQIRQGGSRTAALMFMLNDWHPDILEFVDPTDSAFSRANFSVSVSDDFMTAVRQDAQWPLVFPDTTHELYDLLWNGDIEEWRDSGLPVVVHKWVPARHLWSKILKGAHNTGSPGMSFMERCNRESNTWYKEKYICMNPCGEQPLPASGSCNLGSINLTAFWSQTEKSLKWNELAHVINKSVRFLDNIIDISKDINAEIGDTQRGVRRIGLGTMGLADIFILMGIRYGSKESLDVISQIFSFIRDHAYMASVELAKERGPAPYLDTDLYLKGEFIKRLPDHIKTAIRVHGIRNLQILTQAPTGTTSILAGASSGIEPIFSKAYTRRDATGEHQVVHPLFENMCGDHMVTASDLSVVDHIQVQAEIQKYLDSSISKTINLPNDATEEDVGSAYAMAYDMGCKGVTIYRSGSLDEDVLYDDQPSGGCEVCNL